MKGWIEPRADELNLEELRIMQVEVRDGDSVDYTYICTYNELYPRAR